MRRSVSSEEICGARNETAAEQLGIVCMTRCSSGTVVLAPKYYAEGLPYFNKIFSSPTATPERQPFSFSVVIAT